MIDDRLGENPGFRMKEAQLIGYPVMLILGKGWKKTGLIDVEVRNLFHPSKRGNDLPSVDGYRSRLES